MLKKQKKPKYKLKIQIGKKPIKGKVYRFETDDPVKAITSINAPKIVEECFFTLEYEGKKRIRALNAFNAKRILNNKLSAFYFIKTMKWILK